MRLNTDHTDSRSVSIFTVTPTTLVAVVFICTLVAVAFLNLGGYQPSDSKKAERHQTLKEKVFDSKPGDLSIGVDGYVYRLGGDRPYVVRGDEVFYDRGGWGATSHITVDGFVKYAFDIVPYEPGSAKYTAIAACAFRDHKVRPDGFYLDGSKKFSCD